jgi:hypothetical protein
MGMVNAGVMTIICYYCGHTSHSMVQAARHETARPESCLVWRQRTMSEFLPDQGEEIDLILKALTVQGEGKLDRALDDYFERIERVYR